jgi:hypothetical protein
MKSNIDFFPVIISTVVIIPGIIGSFCLFF